MIFPEKFEQKIEFDKIKTLIQAECLCEMGKEEIAALSFSSDPTIIKTSAGQIAEFMRLMNETSNEFPLDGYYDIRSYIKRIQTEGAYITEAELFELYRSTLAVGALVRFFRMLEVKDFPLLISFGNRVEAFPEVTQYLSRILDKYGNIKDSASSTLAQIRREKQMLNASISKLINQIIRTAQSEGFVEKDCSPVLRDGRLVIPVAPAFKRKLGGIVHDESATGKTVFVEPAQLVEVNNKIRELEADERREIIKILIEAANFIRPYSEELLYSNKFLAETDALRAKAIFSTKIGSRLTQCVEKPHLDWKNAIHPLLLLSFREHYREDDIVPLNITLHENQRILLISGPNAGGKSICIKTVGLLQYMWQCGLLIPTLEDSVVGIFDNIFIDIGDEQSLENDLSTYSSHLNNMKFFLKNGNHSTLLIIDEFGSGTEPLIGGAIAEAELNRFNENKCFGVINTHYTNLKHFANHTQGVVNGAMLYDRHLMKPLFQLSIGNPGSSFAVEIARKIGLPEDVINHAAEIVGKEHLEYDKNLQDIVRDKRYWENKRQQVRMKEKKLDSTSKALQDRLEQIEKERKEIIRKAKQEAKDLIQDTNATIENTIRQIKQAKADKEKTKAIRRTLEEKKSELNDKPKEVQPTIQTTNEEIKVGDNVVYGEHIGEVLSISGKKAVVALGGISSTINLNLLKKAKRKDVRKQEQRTVSALSSIETLRQRSLKFKTQLDIRGLRLDEAMQTVMYYIDDAMMVGVGEVRILHGTGTGALRQMVREYLSTVSGLSFKDEHVQLGGAGITVVNFRN